MATEETDIMGPETVKTIIGKAAWRLMPIIMISAFGSVPDAVRALKAGVCDFFQKPCCTETLLRSIHAAFDAQRRRNVRRQENALRDQLLTRSELEARDMGYVNVTLLGFLRDRAPVTGELELRRTAVPWASRFGLSARA